MSVRKINPFLKWLLITIGVFLIAWIIMSVILDLSFAYLLSFYALYLAVFIQVFKADIIGEIGFFSMLINQKENAYKLCSYACEMGTNSVHALHFHGIRQLREGQPEEALELLKKAKRKNTSALTDKTLYLNISACYWKLNKIDTAIETIDEMRNRYSYVNPDVYTMLGYLYISKADFAKAEDYTQRALKDNPEHGPALDNMGQIHYMRGEYDEAAECFLKAIEVKPTMADSKYYLGMIYELKGEPDNAKKYFQLAADTNITALNTITREQIDEKLAQYT